MKMEKLIGRLGESENVNQRVLSESMEREYLELAKNEDLDARNKSFNYLNGCIKTMLALGGITDAEEDELWHELFTRMWREERS